MIGLMRSSKPDRLDCLEVNGVRHKKIKVSFQFRNAVDTAEESSIHLVNLYCHVPVQPSKILSIIKADPSLLPCACVVIVGCVCVALSPKRALYSWEKALFN